MDECLKQLMTVVQQSSLCTSERQIALTQLVDSILQLRRVCRPFRGQPLWGIYQTLYDQVQQQLQSHLDQVLPPGSMKQPSPDTLRTLLNQTFRMILNDAALEQLALEVKKYPFEDEQQQQIRRYALNQLIEAIWLVRFPSRSQLSSIYEEAIQKALLSLCENIDRFDPQQGQIMAWFNSSLKRVLNATKADHETQPNRFFPHARGKLHRAKYELACLIRKIKLEDLLFWLGLSIRRILPEDYPSISMILILTVLLWLLRLEQTHPATAAEICYAIITSSLTLPRLSQSPNSNEADGENSFWETLSLPTISPTLSERIVDFFREDPHSILQAHVQGIPSATFQAIALRHLEGLTWQAIADSFDSTKFSTFSTFYYRQLQKLAPSIQRHLQEDIY